MFHLRSFSLAALTAACFVPQWRAQAQSNVNRGLWVGEVTLNAVNEVAVPLDQNNVPKAPDANVPTKTFDSANLRLILHVDGSGHVSLLKDVAVLSRTGETISSENDIALVTEPGLYGSFPPQAAVRIASAVFDFGDSKATDAVNKVVNAAAVAARDAIKAGKSQSTAVAEAQAAANAVIAQSSVAETFNTFLAGPGKKANVVAIANGTAGALTTMTAAAQALLTGSFYADSRGVEMVAAIDRAVNAATTPASKITAAQNTAASFADLSNNYERFLVGQIFGKMITGASEAAATAAAAAEVKSIANLEGTGGAAPLKITSANHGLGNGEEIAIFGAGTSAYNGVHTVTRINADQFSVAVPYVAGKAITGYQPFTEVAPVTVKAPGHGLTSGAKVTIYASGQSSYNATFLATVIDADSFSIPTAYATNPAQKGEWSSKSGLITNYEGTTSGTAGVKITAVGHGLVNGQEIMISDSGKASYNGVKTITRLDNDSFSINQAFDGNPALKGVWSIRNPIVSYAPPSVLTTMVVSAGHGLSTGDTITLSGAGKTAYNGEQTVEVIDPDKFTISIDWDETTGNPTAKGVWAPLNTAKWRRISSLRSAIANNVLVNDAKTEALKIQVVAYSDSRSTDAINAVLNAIINKAAVAPIPFASQISADAGAAGRAALQFDVKRYEQPSARPTPDYNEFVTTPAFKGSAATAANAAVAAALFEKQNNTLATDGSMLDKALQAAITALNSVYSAAARAVRSDLPLTGNFGPGQSNLLGTIILPANHPTNPFRHRRHPDHTVGFDITRKIKLSFDGQDGDSLATAGFGVQRITGTYEEEIFGLHKPLGPNQNIGLKVKGTFQLNRISLIDALNGR